jgi:hypothetical protein
LDGNILIELLVRTDKLLVEPHGCHQKSGDADPHAVMKPTPDLSHITEETYLEVYEPAGLPLSYSINAIVEDTFILLDALEQDIPRLRALSSQKSSSSIVVEIGCPTLRDNC